MDTFSVLIEHNDEQCNNIIKHFDFMLRAVDDLKQKIVDEYGHIESEPAIKTEEIIHDVIIWSKERLIELNDALEQVQKNENVVMFFTTKHQEDTNKMIERIHNISTELIEIQSTISKYMRNYINIFYTSQLFFDKTELTKNELVSYITKQIKTFEKLHRLCMGYETYRNKPKTRNMPKLRMIEASISVLGFGICTAILIFPYVCTYRLTSPY